MHSPVDKIKERLSIEEVVSSYIKLEGAGSNLKARCPFHSEKTPSFFVSPGRGTYYCFGCGASGDIFTFVEEFEGLDFKGALKLLADKAGIRLEPYEKGEGETKDEKERLYLAMEESSRFFEKNLKENKPVLEYLKSRGVLEKTIADFRLGFSLPEWRALFDHLKSKGFTDKEIEKAGLAKKPEEAGKTMYDRFRGRLMFPISDSSGRIIAFSGRIFSDDGKSAKYLNSPDTPIFKKSSILYGLDKAKQSIRKNDFSIVVEGQFDLILSHQAGFRNTVATSGTALSDTGISGDDKVNNLGMVSHLSENIVFVFDGDEAGLKASERATPIGLALFKDMNVKAASIPEGMDPAELILQKGVDAWKEAIRNSKHIIEFLADRHISQNVRKDPLHVKLTVEKKIIPYLKLIQNPIKRSHFISLISAKSGIREEDIREILGKDDTSSFYTEREDSESKVSGAFRKDYILRKLLGIILWQKSVKKTSGENHIDVDPILKEVSEVLGVQEKDILDADSKIQLPYRTLGSDEDLIFEAEVFYGKFLSGTEGVESLRKDTEELLSNLKEEHLKEELADKMRKLNEAEEGRDSESAAKIFKECQILNEKIQAIKNGRLKL